MRSKVEWTAVTINDGQTLSVCSICVALVNRENRERHEKWHGVWTGSSQTLAGGSGETQDPPEDEEAPAEIPEKQVGGPDIATKDGSTHELRREKLERMEWDGGEPPAVKP